MRAEAKVSEFLSSVYTDEKLAALLAHAQDGKLAFISCCCFAGVPSAVHALCAWNENFLDLEGHDPVIDSALPWFEMSDAFGALGPDDHARRERIIPLIQAEMDRRESEGSESSSKSLQRAVLSV